MDSILKFQEEPGSKSRMQPYETSEIVMIALRALEYQGKHQEALAFLEKNGKYIVDTVAKNDTLGRLHHHLGHEQEAVAAYETLL